MSEKFPATDEAIISEPLSDEMLDSVSGGTLDRSAAPDSDGLQVQMSMQRENQIFTSVSNVLETRQDTVKNSIGNVK